MSDALNTESVAERLERTQIDLQATHDQIATGMSALAARIHARLALSPHAAADPVRRYGTPGAMQGEMQAFTGPKMHWLIESWLGNPTAGFTNHHITAWMPADTRVPHLGIAVGTIPEIFWYIDYVPRVDAQVDVGWLDRYIDGALNELWLEIHADPRFAPFVSKSPYMREAISASGICVTADVDPSTITFLFDKMRAVVERWLDWVVAGDPVPPEERAAQAARDLHLRRTIIERDPANIIAEKVLGTDFTHQLLRVMWGEAREVSS